MQGGMSPHRPRRLSDRPALTLKIAQPRGAESVVRDSKQHAVAYARFSIWRYAPCFPPHREHHRALRRPGPEQRLRLPELPKRPDSGRLPDACIGKPDCWTMRPAGGGGR